jgi:hypothetical protein
MWLEKKQQMPMFGYIGGKLVEAVGVEPTSETTIDREPSCFFQFAFVS